MPKILFIGDIVGCPGREMVARRLPERRSEYAIDCVVANAENAAGGSGLNKKIAEGLLGSGVDAITLGDHVWDQRGFEKDIKDLPNVCRPANLPSSCPGARWVIVKQPDFRLGVFTVLGRHFMQHKADCPFLCADALLESLKAETDAVLVEIHAEATSEKIAFGWYMDGRVLGVVGTHTHVPTADYRVLPRGAGYISDVGMSGPYHSCLGREIRPVLGRFLDGMPRRFEVATEDVRLCGVLLESDPDTGLCRSIRRIEVPDQPVDERADSEHRQN